MKTLILFSSANKEGNTAKAVADVADNQDVEIVDIDTLNITAYNYQNNYPIDDFYPLVEKMLNADSLLFASPVYWHSVTAPMKSLVDRMTELLDVAELKPKARALEAKKGFVVASSASPELSPHFKGFFDGLFSYFNIELADMLHAPCRDGYFVDPKQLAEFRAKLNQ